MKRLSCPKCGAYITFDETAYAPGSILVFECAACKKQFKARVNIRSRQSDEEVYGQLTVVENVFHNKQILPLKLGENIIGRYVKGTNANVPIETSDPSIDTTHCIIQVKPDKKGRIQFVLRDAPSNTGTFCQDEILKDSDRINLADETIITLGATTVIFKILKHEI